MVSSENSYVFLFHFCSDYTAKSIARHYHENADMYRVLCKLNCTV